LFAPNTASIAARNALEPSIRRQPATHQVVQEFGHDGRVFAGAFPQAQHMLLTCRINANRAQNMMLAEPDAIEIDDEKVQIIQTPIGQFFQQLLAGLDVGAAHGALADADRLGHLRDHAFVLPRAHAIEQDRHHPRGQLAAGLDRFVGGNDRFAISLMSQPRPTHPQLAVAEVRQSLLAAVPTHVARLLSRRFASGHFPGRHLQHGLDAGPAGHVDDLLDGQLRLLDEPDHGDEELTFADEKIRQLPLVGGRHDLVRCHCGGSFPLEDESQPILT